MRAVEQTELGALWPHLSPSVGSAVCEKVPCSISGMVFQEPLNCLSLVILSLLEFSCRDPSSENFSFWDLVALPQLPSSAAFSLFISGSLNPFTLCLFSHPLCLALPGKAFNYPLGSLFRLADS